ncbi:hypothetical protein [Hydrotalea sp.]|uniref:DUF7935 family protein n=1 Tax=Hydrotalea sp. TaxID=2881279 RepID=UPI00262E53F2|nr:hypothetical protein [Hydrotalea sp.]
MNNTVIFSILIALIILNVLWNFWPAKNKAKGASPILSPSNDANTQLMQLQAYERLVLLVDRIAIPNLVSRLNTPGTSAMETQVLLTQTIKQEFEHNITQQIYVSADAWKAVKNLKDQNIYIINQLAQNLSPDASGTDLNKLLLEYMMTDKKGNLCEVASEIISHEAKQVLS